MFWREVCTLIKTEEKLDRFNRPYKHAERRDVFCNEKGVKRNEFYQAQAQGYRPELCVEIKASEYNRETHIEYLGTVYRVIRSYPEKNECLELIAEATVAENRKPPAAESKEGV